MQRDWNARGRLDDFFAAFADWHFDWLDVAALIRATETVLAYPMVDQDPLPRWSFGRVTLLGDAAHPMVPRGSNGAGQAILDARCLADQLAARGVGAEALAEYDRIRNAATAKIVLANRSTPPDAILREVHERSGDKPFARIEDVVSREELARIADAYKQVAGLKPVADDTEETALIDIPRCGDAASSPSLGAGALAGLDAGAARAQAAWPGKPVRIVVPFTPGTGMDILARTLAPHLQAGVGPGDRRRQPARRVGQPRRRRGREVAARRPDAADGRQHADHQSGAVLEHELRPAQGPGADRPVRDRLVPARRRRRRRHQVGRRAGQGGAREAGHARLRVARHRDAASHGDGAVQAARQGVDHAHPVLGHRRRGQRGARRATCR